MGRGERARCGGPGARHAVALTGDPTMTRWAFDGHIAGFGTSEGTRVVIGRWLASPLGAFDLGIYKAGEARRFPPWRVD